MAKERQRVDAGMVESYIGRGKKECVALMLERMWKNVTINYV